MHLGAFPWLVRECPPAGKTVQSSSLNPPPEEQREAAFLPFLGLQEAHSCPRSGRAPAMKPSLTTRPEKASMELPLGPRPHKTPGCPRAAEAPPLCHLRLRVGSQDLE